MNTRKTSQKNKSTNEDWIYRNHRVIGKIRSGLKKAAEGVTEKVEDVDEFLKNLGVK